MIFDIDGAALRPEWSLNFGNVLLVGRAAAMFVEPDGTQHPLKVDHTAIINSKPSRLSRPHET